MAKPVADEVIRTAENVFREYLRDRDLKYTTERRVLLEAVMRKEGHFEIEDLTLDLRHRGHRVAKATVYRTIPLLVNCGIVKQVQLSNKQTHYEHTYGQDPHDHMVCRRCGRIVEFDSSDVSRLRSLIAGKHDFYALSHRFAITGLCAACVKACPVAGPLPRAATGRKGP